MAKKNNYFYSEPDNLNTKEYLWSMSHALKIDQDLHWFQLLPISFFTAFIIIITRMYSYERPMGQFYWSSGETSLTDFFSYYKMFAILVCAVIVILYLLFRLTTQSFAVKRSSVYIPMVIYSAFTLLSHKFSDYQQFALWGWNDRFEGTLVLLAYMVMLFYVINTINTETAVKFVVYPLAVTSALLGLLGVSQAMDHDFFRTALGQKILLPNTMTESGSMTWDLIDQAAAAGEQLLRFTFQNKEIYQTVYNINYVSFYLTLLLPLFGLIFIRSIMKGKEEPIWKKVIWGLLFALQLYNLIGSASSGGFLGMGVVVLIALVLLNKQILNWRRPIVILLAITVLVGGITYERWMPELTMVFGGLTAPSGEATQSETVSKGHIDYIETEGSDILFGYNGEDIRFTTDSQTPNFLIVTDESGTELTLVQSDISERAQVDDDRFRTITVEPKQDSDGDNYWAIATDGHEWLFYISAGDVKFVNPIGKLVDLEKIPAVGWESNQDFGSGRGYIWSRTIPMIKDTLFLGHGADTYCIYYPQLDYAGKYNTVTFGTVLSIIVDKPHNMYMGMAVGTGLISVLTFLTILGLYAVQSIRLFWRKKYDSFIDYAGVGIFLGIMGFAVTGMVDDSSVSVMPMFYGLLGTGIAINMMLQRQRRQQLEHEKRSEKAQVKAKGGISKGDAFKDDLFKTKTNA